MAEDPIYCQDDEDFDMESDSVVEDDSSEKHAKDPDYDFDIKDSEGGFTDDDEDFGDDSTTSNATDIVDSNADPKDQDWDLCGESSQQPEMPTPASSRHRHRNASGGFTTGVVAELVPWLKRNFRLSRNATAIMPRSELYAKYETFCAQKGLPVVNSACLGKVLRRSFPGVDTRRLGRRGESKYHYIGLEINPGGDANGQADITDQYDEHKPNIQAPLERYKPKRNPPHMPKKRSSLFRLLAALDDNDRIAVVLAQLQETIHSIGAKHTSFLPDVLQTDHKWAEILPLTDQEVSSMGIRANDVATFVESFRVHLGMVAYCIVTGAFVSVPELFRNFWITRTASIQVSESMSSFDTSVVNSIFGWEPLQHFIRECYLESFKKVEEQFDPNYESVCGNNFASYVTEFAQKFPGWIRSAVGDLDSDMLHILYTTALSLSFRLKKTMELHISYAKIYPMQNDPAKSEFINQIFAEVEPTWKRHIEIGFTAVQQQEMQNAVQITMNLLLQPQNVAEWRSWIVTTFQRKLAALEDGTGAEHNTILPAELRTLREIVLMWIIISKRLVAIARTDVKPVGKLIHIEPFLWLMEFFQQFVKTKGEELQASIQNRAPIFQLYQMLSENANSKEPAAVPDMQLSMFTDFYIENLEQVNPNNHEFFSSCSDIKSYIFGNSDKLHVDAVASSGQFNFNDQSILEQLLR